MAMVLNTSGRRLKLKGVSIGPREMADVPMAHRDLKEHLFVRSGALEVSGGFNEAAPKRERKGKAVYKQESIKD